MGFNSSLYLFKPGLSLPAMSLIKSTVEDSFRITSRMKVKEDEMSWLYSNLK
jgi:hypothetical protein